MVDFADISLLDILHKLPPGGHPDIEANVCRLLPSSHRLPPAWRQASAIFFFLSYSSSLTQIRPSFSPSFRLPQRIVILSVLDFPTASLLAIFSLSRLFISPPPSSSRDVEIVFRRREWGEGRNNALNPE